MNNIKNDQINKDESSEEDQFKVQKIKLKEEILTFLNHHTVYETIPENMKV